MVRIWGTTGGLACALAVLLSALGAHHLTGRIPAGELTLWETASRYLFMGGVGQVLAALLAAVLEKSEGSRGASWAGRSGACLLLGSVLFSGSLYALALGAPHLIGAVTPFGGLLLIGGFLLLALSPRLR